MKGKKILTTFLASALAVTTIAGSMSPIKAEDTATKLNMYRFYNASADGEDASYSDGYWAKEGQSYKPLWTYTATEGDKTGQAMLQPNYFRTEDGKVAYCIDPAKKEPTSITETGEKVSNKTYGVIKAGYPATSGDAYGISDIELEWATTWAVKAVTGGTANFDGYKLSKETEAKTIEPNYETPNYVEAEYPENATDEEKAAEDARVAELNKAEDERVAAANAAEDERVAKAQLEENNRAAAAKASAEKIKEVAMKLAASSSAEYDMYEIDDSEAVVALEKGIYKIGPYKVNQNINATTTTKLEGAPSMSAVVEENGSYYVTIPQGSVVSENTFTLTFTGDKKVVGANIYNPANDDEQRIYVADVTDAKAVATITVAPEVPVDKGGKIAITKKDTDGNYLEGVVFEIYAADGKLADTITTNEKGFAESKLLNYGSYTMTETKTVSGYVLSKEVYNISLQEKAGSDVYTYSKTITNKKNSVEITKIGSDTKKGIEGAELVVKNEVGQEIYKGKTDSTGKITLTGLAVGKYTVTETTAPKGYLKTDEAITFSIDEYGVITGSTTLTNEPLKDVTIKKVGSDDTKKGLKDAEIEVRDSAKNVILKGKTDKNGELVIPDVAPGKYTFVEITAPKGYALNDTKYTFEVTEAGEIKGTTEIKNNPIKVELKKTDENDKVLEGATFEVKNADKETVFVGKTNSKGIVEIEKLEPGTYTFKETVPPAGYKLNTKSFTFKVDEYGKVSGTTTIKDEITVVTIIKKDKADSKVLAGAKITIKDSNGKVVAEGTTGSDGKFEVKGLAPGTYVYTEDTAPEGYVKTNEKATFTINSKGEDLTLTLYNSKLDLKTNSTTSTSNSSKNNGSTTNTTTNSKGEIIKTGVDDTVRNMIPVYILVVAIVAAGAVVIIRKKASKKA